MLYNTIGNLTRFGSVALVVLIGLSLFIRHQYNLYQHFVALENGELKTNNGTNNISINAKTIKDIEYSKHSLNLKLEGMEYKFKALPLEVEGKDQE